MQRKSIIKWTHTVVAVLTLAAILAACSPATTAAPTAVPPTAVPPTAVPPTVAVPTAVPPTAVPPTAVPPTAVVVDPAYVEGLPTAVIPAGEAGKPMITAAYNTIIRSGPGTNYVVYGAFVGGSTATAVGVNSDTTWYAISVPVAPGGIGWVDAAYAIPQDTSGLPVLSAPPVPPTVDLVPPAAGDPQATALTETYVRTGPGANYPAYGFAPAGANARVIGKNTDGSWLVVRLDPAKVGAGYGWVETAFTTPSNIDAVAVINAPEAPPVVEAPAPAEGAPTATAIDYINVRSGPGTNYYILGYAAPGATAEVSGKSEDGAWWQVKIPTSFSPDGFGWVSADWVTTANTDSVAVVAAPAPPTNAVSTQPPPATSCTLVSQDPADGTHFAPSTGFGVSWVLKNTGSTSWEGPNTNLVFLGAVSGQRLHQNGDMYGISQNVDPGGTYTVSGSMISPADPGQYGEAWSLINTNGTTYCTFWIIINVP